MSMQLRISHTTGFTYEGKATASFNEARLTPQTMPGQIVAHSRLEVSPTPWTYSYRDYWGTQVTAFEVLEPHNTLTVTASATVHTDRQPVDAPEVSWAELAADVVQDEHTEYLAVPVRVAPPEDLAESARAIAADAADPGAAARAICGLVHREVQYVVGSTRVESTAADAWQARAGVCQDMAHLVIGALRSIKVPARYVSGYLHPKKEPVIGEPVVGESHAWIEWWDGAWRGYDPTNDTAPGDRHVVVAVGRDYKDVRPLAGIFSGTGTSDMFVDVEVTRLA